MDGPMVERKKTMNIGDEVIDSREIIERIDELEGDDERDEEETQELEALKVFADEAAGYAPDWSYGETLILDRHFTDYAQQLAEDIGAIDAEASWPNTYIDWDAAADALKMDYAQVSVEIDGRTYEYWVR